MKCSVYFVVVLLVVVGLFAPCFASVRLRFVHASPKNIRLQASVRDNTSSSNFPPTLFGDATPYQNWRTNVFEFGAVDANSAVISAQTIALADGQSYTIVEAGRWPNAVPVVYPDWPAQERPRVCASLLSEYCLEESLTYHASLFGLQSGCLVRIIHLAPDTPLVSVGINQGRAAALSFASELTLSEEVPAGKYDVQVEDYASGRVLLSQIVALEAGKRYTAILIGYPEPVDRPSKILVLSDD